MKKTVIYERLMPTTMDGHIIKVSTYFSSFDKSEIDKLQEQLKDIIGSGLVSEVLLEDMRGAE